MERENLEENTVYIDKTSGQGCALAFIILLLDAVRTQKGR